MQALPIIKKMLLLALITMVFIAGIDGLGLFNASTKDDHTTKKWDSFYKFTQDNEVDILLMGSSHMYTGLNPKNLSCALGVNAFVLAAPGTRIMDTYYALEEALARTNPQVVVVETYGIKASVNKELTGGNLSDQSKSFSARKNFGVKFKSSFDLFSFQNLPYAWSTTLRNHHFILNDFKQLKKNFKRIGDETSSELFLGRFIRFKSGISESVLDRYKQEGAPVDGVQFKLNDEAKEYTNRIIELCNERKIKLVFLTLPMYKDHVTNYFFWQTELKKLLEPSFSKNCTWLDLQDPYDDDFTFMCFEDTYGKNQHMTYQGSLLAAYKFARYLNKTFPNQLPYRGNDPAWVNMFYGQEGYFENFSPRENDLRNKILIKNKQIGPAKILEIDLLPQKVGQNIFAKLQVDEAQLKQIKGLALQLDIVYKTGPNSVERDQLLLEYNWMVQSFEYLIFSRHIDDRPIVAIEGARWARIER